MFLQKKWNEECVVDRKAFSKKGGFVKHYGIETFDISLGGLCHFSKALVVGSRKLVVEK